MTNIQARLLEVSILEENKGQRVAFNGLLQAVKMGVNLSDIELIAFENILVNNNIETVTTDIIDLIKSVVTTGFIQTTTKKVASGSIEFSTMLTEDLFGQRDSRYQTAYITINSKKLTAEELTEVYYEAEEMLLAELSGVVDCRRSGCPIVEKNSYSDAIEFMVEYGSITEAKNCIKKAWKNVKAKLNIR